MHNLSFFERVHLAELATQRAKEHLEDSERFNGEWDTVKLWTDNTRIRFYGVDLIRC